MQCYEFAACFGSIQLAADYKYRDGRPGMEVPARPIYMYGEFPSSYIGGNVLSLEARERIAESLAGRGHKRMLQVAALRVWQLLFGRPGADAGLKSIRNGSGVRPTWADVMPKAFATAGKACFDTPCGAPWMDDDFSGNRSQEGVQILQEIFELCDCRMGKLQQILARTDAYGRECGDVEQSSDGTFLPLSPRLRRLPSEVVWDTLVALLPAQQEWLPSNLTAQVPDPHHPLSLLGRGRREWPDESGTPASFELAGFMMKGPVVQSALDAQAGRSLQVDEAFLSILGRKPTPEEQAAAKHHAAQCPQTVAQDLTWALLNTNEFLFER